MSAMSGMRLRAYHSLRDSAVTGRTTYGPRVFPKGLAGCSKMTEAELETELCAIVAEELQLLAASRRLRRTPAALAGLAAHRERLQAHTARIRAFSDAIDGPSALQRLPTACPVCQSPSIVRRPYAETYRCVECRSEWMMTLLDAQARQLTCHPPEIRFQTDRGWRSHAMTDAELEAERVALTDRTARARSGPRAPAPHAGRLHRPR
jgi:hypothetical protein